ncbi:MAG: hypothetical protein ACR2N3_15905, partial [Pyrinomonadaceae bacterium]
EEKVSAVFFFGVVLTALGWIWNFWFPINKSLWTSSYAVFMAGLALCFLGFCYWLIDIKNYRKWTKPFVIFGSNALALYFFSSIFARIMNNISWKLPDGAATNVQKWIFDTFFSPLASPYNASLIYSISYIFLWLFLMWMLYRKRIFIKVSFGLRAKIRKKNLKDNGLEISDVILPLPNWNISPRASSVCSDNQFVT